jgi:carboxymethylenebutenolidase
MAQLEDIVRDTTRGRVARASSREAVLLIPSAMGLNAFVDEKLIELAQAGFTALAWDPFYKYPDLPAEKRSAHTDTVQQDAAVQKEHVRWLDYLKDEAGMERIGVLGFCMGARMSLALPAADARVDAAVSYYPTIRDPKPANVLDLLASAASIPCPVLVHYPGLDHLTSHTSFHKLRAALESRKDAGTFVHFHPRAHHGFQSKTSEENRDDYAAGLLAWPATLAFLKATLKTAS